MFLRMLFVMAAVLAGAVATSNAAMQLAEPPRLLERIDPVFPVAAKAAGVEGDVRFRASIDAWGSVQQVHIESVPQPNLGFEEAVTSAVSRWRFSPARLRGVPAPSEYAGMLRFTLTLPGQAMLSASSRDTWNAVRGLVRRLRIPTDRLDDAAQFVASGRTRYAALQLPDAAALQLPIGFVPERFTLYVYVTPRMEPARVSVGTVMEVRSIADSDRRSFVVYGRDVIARWFLSELVRDMNVRMELLSASAEGRAAQSKDLMPVGLTDPCTAAPARLLPMPSPKEAPTSPVKRPRPLQDIKPIYPVDQLEARKTAKILFHGEITEHGTLVNPTMTEPADAPASFVTAAQLAFGLWRFTPAETQGCPVRVNATFESAFVLRQQ